MLSAHFLENSTHVHSWLKALLRTYVHTYIHEVCIIQCCRQNSRKQSSSKFIDLLKHHRGAPAPCSEEIFKERTYVLHTYVYPALWGRQWKRSCVCFRSDNMAVVSVLTTRTARDPLLMHLLRCLVFYAATYRFSFKSEHIPGVDNTAADAISRNNLSLFTSLLPQIPQRLVPPRVLELLVTQRPDWGSNSWTRAFTRSLIWGSPPPPRPPTSQAGGGTQISAPGSA